MVVLAYMATYSTRLVLACSLLMLMGFGCSKPASPTAQQAKNTQPSKNPQVILFPPAGTPTLSVNDEFRQIFLNFRDLKSFRTSFSMTTDQGSVTGTFRFLRPDRFQGTLHTKDGDSDLIVVGSSFYLRPKGAPWLNYTNTPAAKGLTTQLRQAMDQGSSNFGITDDTIVTKTHDEIRDCDEYKTQAKTAHGAVVSLDVCAVNKLPAYVTIQGPQGPSVIQYDQYNQLFTIEKPI